MAQPDDSLAPPDFLPPGDGRRLDALPEDGSPAGSDPKMVEKQVLQGIGADYVILIPSSSISIIPDPVFAAEVAQAWNDWQIDTWLGKVQLARSLQKLNRDCASESRTGGARDRAPGRSSASGAGSRGFERAGGLRQAPIPSRFGRRPRAIICRPRCMSKARWVRRRRTPLGYPTYFLEFHTLYPTIYMTHLVSLIAEGVFEKYPDFNSFLLKGAAPGWRQSCGAWTKIGAARAPKYPG